jgi:phosphohistidine phosphatase
MTTLYVLRHADAASGSPDKQRPLTPSGRAAVPKVGAHLAAHHPTPQLVLCSAAQRATETLDLLGDAVAGAQIVIEDGIYEAGLDQLTDRLRAVPEETSPVLVIGHNPVLAGLVMDLAGPHAGAVAERFPAGTLAVLDVPCGWGSLAWGSAQLLDHQVPRALA